MLGLTSQYMRSGLTARELGLCSENGLAWVSVAGSVNNIFDLTTPSNLKAFTDVIASFHLSARVRQLERRMGLAPMNVITDSTQLHTTFMAEEWRQYPVMWNTPANPQLIGHLLTQAGFEGVLYNAKRQAQRCPFHSAISKFLICCQREKSTAHSYVLRVECDHLRGP